MRAISIAMDSMFPLKVLIINKSKHTHHKYLQILLKIVKIGQKEGIKNISAGRVKIQCLYMYLDNFLFS